MLATSVIVNYLAAGCPNTVFWLENNDGVVEGVLFTANGLAGGVKLLVGWDGLQACCPKRDMLPNAEPGELKPNGWPNDVGWLAAAATDPNNPLEAGAVEGEPKIDDVVLVAVGVPKMDDLVVEAAPNIELDDAETAGFPNIDELVVTGDPKTVDWTGVPKPPVVLVVVADPNIEETVVVVGAPNIDEVVFIGLPNIDDVVVVLGVPKIEEAVVAFVGVPNIDDEVVAFVGEPNIEDALVVLVVEPKIDVAVVELTRALNNEGALVVFVGVLKIEGALVVFVELLKIDVWVTVVEFPKILVVLVALIDVPKIEVLIKGGSKLDALSEVTGMIGTFSFSGVTGSDIIGVGLSESRGVVSVTLLLVVAAGIVLKTGFVLTTSKDEETVDEPTGSLATVEIDFFGGSEKLNDVDTDVDVVGVNMDLASVAGGFDASSLGVVKLNDENDEASGFEVKLKVAFSSLSFDFSSIVDPDNVLGVSKGLDKIFDVSKLKLDNGVSFEFSILFLIESAKLKFVAMLALGTVDSVLTVDPLAKLKGILSFDSEKFVETVLRELKFKGTVADDLKLKSTGSFSGISVEVLILPKKGVVVASELGVSLIKALYSNLFEKLLSKTGLEVEEFSTEFLDGVIMVLVGKGLDPNENAVEVGTTVIGVDLVAIIGCVVGINKGLLDCVMSDLDTDGSSIFGWLTL